MLILSHYIFKKYIYLVAHISKHLFLHFSYTISYTLTTIFHKTQYTITHLMFILSLSYSRNTSILLLISLNISFFILTYKTSSLRNQHTPFHTSPDTTTHHYSSYSHSLTLHIQKIHLSCCLYL